MSFVETWLNDELQSMAQMHGYQLVTKHKRGKKEGGGIGVYVANNIKFKVLDIMIPINLQNKFDCLFIEVEEYSKPLIIGTFYRTPSMNSQKEFTDFLTPLLSELKNTNKEVIIAGDMNIDLLKAGNNSATANYLDAFVANSFIPKITVPTRTTHSSATLIDHVFHKLSNTNTSQGTITHDISDHYSNFIMIEMKSPIKTHSFITHRLMKPNNIQDFYNALQSHNWSRVIDCKDANQSYTLFLDEYKTLMNNHLPLITKRFNRKYHKVKSWITRGIMNSLVTRNNIHRKLLKCKNEELRLKLSTELRNYRNILNRTIRAAKKMYWQDKFDSCRNDMKLMWRNINDVLSRTKNKHNFPDHFMSNRFKITDRERIANEFNKFYCELGPTLAQNIPHKPMIMPHNNIRQSLFFEPVIESEIINIVTLLKPKSSYGFDDISPKLLKATFMPVVAPLIHVFNLSLQQGYCPEDMKKAKVIPIFKNGDKHLFCNYRPISLLPTFSKLLEKIVFNRLMKHLKKYDILSKSQFGFRENLSTELAILELQDRIIKNIINKQCTMGVFLDLAKAYDTINHEILIKKLEHYGVRGVTLAWFKSYLTDRSQYTAIDNQNSDTQHVRCGIPQGSILGPLLFILYVNDITQSSSQGNLILFADDTNIIYNDLSYADLYSKAQIDLSSVCDWFASNKLSVNESKTKFMVFHSVNKQVSNEISKMKLLVNKQDIERVASIKFLGVKISDTLTWEAHINEVASKVSKVVAVLTRLKHELPPSVLYTIYNSLILSRINYAITAWGNASAKKLKRLVILQKKAIRIVTNSTYNSHAGPIFYRCNTLPLKQQFKFDCCRIYHRKLKGKLPDYHTEQLQINATLHNYETRQSQNVHVTRNTHQLSKDSICNKIGNSWNELQNDTKQFATYSQHTFSKHLKRLFLTPLNKPCRKRHCFPCALKKNARK